jgi:hypothetical protein
VIRTIFPAFSPLLSMFSPIFLTLLTALDSLLLITMHVAGEVIS